MSVPTVRVRKIIYAIKNASVESCLYKLSHKNLKEKVKWNHVLHVS